MTANPTQSELPDDVKTSVIRGLKPKLDKLLTSSRSDSSRQLVISLQGLLPANDLTGRADNVAQAWSEIENYIGDKANSHRTLYKEIQVLLSRANKEYVKEQKINRIVAREVGKLMPDMSEEEKKGFGWHVWEKFTQRRESAWGPVGQGEHAVNRKLRDDIVSKSPDKAFDTIIKFLCVAKNKQRSMYRRLMSMLYVYRMEIADQYIAKKEWKLAIAQLKYVGYEGYERLGKCYEGDGDEVEALKCYLNAYAVYSHGGNFNDIQSKKRCSNKVSKCLFDLIKSSKNLDGLKKFYSENHGGRTSQLVSRSIKKLFSKYSSGEGAAVQGMSFGVASLGIASTGLVRGLFHAATRKSPSKVEMENLIGDLHHFAAKLTEEEKKAVIKNIVGNYGSQKSNLATSDSSKILFSRLKSQNISTDLKVDAILEYMFAFNANKVIHNKGKRLFNVIAKACAEPREIKLKLTQSQL